MFCSSKTGADPGRGSAAGSRTQDTSGLSHQCVATEPRPRQPDNHQPSQSSIYTAQVVLFFTFLYFRLITSLFPACGKMVLAFRVRKTLSMGSFLTDRIFRSTPNGVLTAHTEWLSGVRLRHSVPPVQYIWRIVGVGGCPAVVAQWQSTGSSSQRCPGFDSRRLPAFFHFRLFSPHNIQIHSLVTF